MLAIRPLLPAFIILVFLYACTKDDLPQAGGERLHKIIRSNDQDDSMHYVTFNYDAQGRLAVIEDSNSQTHMHRTLISYNNDNKMIKIVRTRYYGSPSNLLGQEGADSFVYNNDNRIIKRLAISTQNNNPAYTTSNTYSYDEQGRLVTDTAHSIWTNGIAGLTTFTYDTNDNVIKSEKRYYSSGVLQDSAITQMTYTSQDNPYKNLGSAAYFLLYDKDMVLSKQAPLLVLYPYNTIISYNYEYYNNGLPRKVINEYSGQNNSPKSTTEFFYQ
jgi:YD repeat-containing protein